MGWECVCVSGRDGVFDSACLVVMRSDEMGLACWDTLFWFFGKNNRGEI